MLPARRTPLRRGRERGGSGHRRPSGAVSERCRNDELPRRIPAHADIEAGKISILFPSAARLLGLRVGQSNDWNLPRRRYRIIAAPYQPEAAGDPG